jgi:phosphoglucomutase
VIKGLEDEGVYKYIFSFEESYGYLIGDYARDKDAVTASMLIAEMAAWYFGKGMTLFEAMGALYEKYGYFSEQTLNLMMPGLDGLDKMKKLMRSLRQSPPAEIAGTKVSRLRDYLSGEELETDSGRRQKMDLSGSDVLYFLLADDTRFIVRPSGTVNQPETRGRMVRGSGYTRPSSGSGGSSGTPRSSTTGSGSSSSGGSSKGGSSSSGGETRTAKPRP